METKEQRVIRLDLSEIEFDILSGLSNLGVQVAHDAMSRETSEQTCKLILVLTTLIQQYPEKAKSLNAKMHTLGQSRLVELKKE